jgi:hypothetical protein
MEWNAFFIKKALLFNLFPQFFVLSSLNRKKTAKAAFFSPPAMQPPTS